MARTSSTAYISIETPAYNAVQLIERGTIPHG
jgi:hypothetical protein